MPINLSHCRIQNTRDALRELCETIEDVHSDKITDAEREALVELLLYCGNLVVRNDAGEFDDLKGEK